MDKDNIKQSIEKRLNRIEGQVRGIKKMVDGNQQCNNVLIQIAAIKAAINKVGGIILEDYAKSCINYDTLEGKNSKYTDDLITAILIFMKGDQTQENSNNHLSKHVVIFKLENIEFKIQNIKEMIKTGDRCNNILGSIGEVRTEINTVGQMILENYIRTCIVGASVNGQYENLINNLIDTVLKFIK